MTPCFADAFYFLALLNPTDAHHERVTVLNATLRRTVVTTAFVLLEVGDAMAQPANRPVFLQLIERLRSVEGFLVVPASQELFDEGLSHYTQRADKAWSLTDCISFVVMRQRGMTDALTGDRHFVQAGFNVLLA